MKNIVLLALLLCGASPLYSQGAMVVTDPTSFAQRAMNFVDQMAEAVEEKYVMYEQIEQMVMQAEDFKKNAEKFKTAMNWVKRAKDFVVIVQAAEDMANDLNEFRNQLTQTDWLNEGERLSLYLKGFGIYSDAMDLIEEAKLYVSDFKSEEDAGLSSAERLELLNRIRSQMATCKTKMQLVKGDAQDVIDRKKEMCEPYLNIYSMGARNQGGSYLSTNQMISNLLK